MVRAAIYTRISLDRDGRSEAPDRQERDARQHCQQRGWDVVEVFCDRDVSAFKANVHRPGFERLMAAVDEKTIDAIVVYRLDRLTRGGVVGITRVLERIQRSNVTLVSIGEAIDTSDAMAKASWPCSLLSPSRRASTSAGV